MSFQQNETTKKFIKAVKSVIDTGQARTVKEISDKIGYNYSAMGLIMAGYRNVPAHVNASFTKTYQPAELLPKEDTTSTLYLHAIGRVALRGIAELLAKQRGDSLIKTLGDLEAAVKVEIRSLEIK